MLKETHRIYRNRLGGGGVGGYVMERMTSGLIRRLGKSPCVAEVESGLGKENGGPMRFGLLFIRIIILAWGGARRREWGVGVGVQLLNNRVMIKRHGSREGVRGDHDVTVSIGD